MTRLTFRIQLPDRNEAGRFAPILMALETLTRINQWQFQRGLAVPLFTSGCVYREEPPGEENWDDAPTCAARGWGDCEDLCAWYVAELRELHGVPAECTLKTKLITPEELRAKNYPVIPPKGIFLIHVLVRMPDGSIIDPSALLGMKAA